MPVSVIPVLSTKLDRLYAPNDQVAYILRHAFYNPGWTSNYIESYLISLQKLFAECSADLSQMAERLKEKLDYSLKTLYNGKYMTTVELVEDNPAELSKRFSISIADAQGNLLLSNKDIQIKDGKFAIRPNTGELE